MSQPPLPPPPPWPPAPALYPPWPPPRRRQFVWWEALAGVVAPFAASLVLFLAGGFGLAFYGVPLLLVAGLVVAGVQRRFTLLACLCAGAVLMVVALLTWFVIFVLFNPRVL